MHNRHDNDMQMEGYLSRVSRRLTCLPPDVREQELAEVQQHVSDLVEANMEMGMKREDAVAVSLRQFGNPVDIGKQLARSWRRGAERNLPGTLGAAVAWGGLASLITYAVHFAVNLMLPHTNIAFENSAFLILRAYGFGLSLSFLNGFVAGVKAPHFSLQGTALVWGIWMLLGLGVFFCFTARHIPHYASVIFFYSYMVSAGLSLSANLLGAHVGRRRFVSQYLQSRRA